MSSDPVELGLYGKLPARGDFIQRNMPRDVLPTWDEWLQQSLVSSREQLGEGWLRYYLNAPLWRFALSPGCCGAQPLTGVWMPSVDRVGRYFPLTVMTALAPDVDLPALVAADQTWFEQLEQVLLGALDDGVDLEAFLAQIHSLGKPVSTPAVAAVALNSPQWHCRLPGLATTDNVLARLCPVLLAQLLPKTTLWWTHGSRHIDACLLLCAGLPDSDRFPALLTGDWSDTDWVQIDMTGIDQPDRLAL